MAMVCRTTAPLAALMIGASVMSAALPAAAMAKTPVKAAKASKAHAKPAKAKAKARKPKAPALPDSIARLADWVRSTGDNEDMPFIVIDKTAALVAVYDGKGKLLGSDAALVGSAQGDDSAPGVGDRELSDIPMEERTTPAGRFIGGFGPASGNAQVLWIDYATAISLHPVITSNPTEKRLARLKSKTPDDNRITHGCINVPVRFYSKVVRPTFASGHGIFYILPDTKPLIEVLPNFYLQTLLSAPKDSQASPTPPEQPAPSQQS
ncbi:MAG: hypothetical protein ACM3W4_09620 [Ignavibacteriales bacterium]